MPPAVPNKAVEDDSCAQPLLSAATDSYHLPTPRLLSVDHGEAVVHNASPM